MATTAKPKIDRAAQLAAKPQRSPQASLERRDDGGAVVRIPVTGGWLFRAPANATRNFELDEIGLLVWDHCDGDTTLEGIVRAVAGRYRLNLREAEVATLKFLDMLAKRGLIGVAEEQNK